MSGAGNVFSVKVVLLAGCIAFLINQSELPDMFEIMESYNARLCVPTDEFEMMMIQCYQT